MQSPRSTVVCFAVKEEARFFTTEPGSNGRIQTLVTGMGPRNAENGIRRLLATEHPGLVLSCGFAGGLRPGLERGSIVFAVDLETNLHSPLLAIGAIPVHFHCADQVATTAEQKRTLRQTTGADAVEMESGIICNACHSHKIPSGTVRVILDTADEDLPLDFNKLMNKDQRIDYARLAMTLVKSPWKIPALLRLQKQSSLAAQKLGTILNEVLLKH
jgi:nucleoside phosphorylase